MFADSGQMQTTAQLFDLGKHTFRLTADDGQYTASDELTVEIKRAPMNRTFIAAGSEWRYLDNGSNQGTKWRARLFDDSKWSTGPAQLGYGNNGEKTALVRCAGGAAPTYSGPSRGFLALSSAIRTAGAGDGGGAGVCTGGGVGGRVGK